jgi:hypothetical protein
MVAHVSAKFGIYFYHFKEIIEYLASVTYILTEYTVGILWPSGL